MKRTVAFFVGGCFLLWIIPLGAFIDAGKERIVCGGKRAVCQCSRNFRQKTEKKLAAAPAGLNFQSSQKESSPGPNIQFLSAREPGDNKFNHSDFYMQQQTIPSYPQVVRLVEHVPRRTGLLIDA